MVYGAQQNGGLKSLKRAITDEGAVSERMRLQHIKEERDRVELERAKTALQQKKITLDHNKADISRRKIESRRLDSEIIHSNNQLQVLDRDVKALLELVSKLSTHNTDITFQLNEHKKKMDQDREATVREHQVENHLNQQLQAVQLKVAREKDVIASISSDMDAISVKIARLTNDLNKIEADTHHAQSQKQYKDREALERKRALTVLTDRKKHEESEIQRLEAENLRLESEIKNLEHTVHNKG